MSYLVLNSFVCAKVLSHTSPRCWPPTNYQESQVPRAALRWDSNTAEITQKNIVRIAKEGGFKHSTLNSCILYVDGTREIVRDSILKSFRNSRQMLDRWRDLTSRMYPNRPDLLARITHANELTIAKIADGGWVMIDTCNSVRKYLRLLVKSIK